MQAKTLIDLLARDRPGDLAEAYRDAMERGLRWREHAKGADRCAGNIVRLMGLLDHTSLNVGMTTPLRGSGTHPVVYRECTSMPDRIFHLAG